MVTELKSPWLLLPRNWASLPGNRTGQSVGPSACIGLCPESTVLRDVLTLGLDPAAEGRCQ